MLKSTGIVLLAGGALALLSACGNTDFDRGVSGAGLGGAAGYALGAPAVGALAGGATGVFTDSDDLDLGDPVWEWD